MIISVNLALKVGTKCCDSPQSGSINHVYAHLLRCLYQKSLYHQLTRPLPPPSVVSGSSLLAAHNLWSNIAWSKTRNTNCSNEMQARRNAFMLPFKLEAIDVLLISPIRVSRNKPVLAATSTATPSSHCVNVLRNPSLSSMHYNAPYSAGGCSLKLSV